MGKLFVPYRDEAPAAVEINGHRLLILATTSMDLVAHLKTLGGNEVREVSFIEDDTKALAELADEVECGVVLTPAGTTVKAMIHSLEAELPWIH